MPRAFRALFGSRFHLVPLFSLVFAALGVVTSRDAGAAAPPFVKGPYLLDVGETTAAVRVEVAPPAPVSIEITREGAPPRTLESTAPQAVHTLRVSALLPATRYGYVVRAAGKESTRGVLVTAPKNDADAPFSFVVYGDNRSDGAAHGAVVRAMLKSPGDFLVNTGDLVATGSDETEWQQFFDIEAPLLRDRPLFAAVGNHELYEGAGDAFLRYLGPSAARAEAPRLYGTFRWGRARFFLLNAFVDWRSGEEREWLERELLRSRDEAGVQWRFAVLHHSPWSSGPHGDNTRLIEAGIPGLLARSKIDLVFAGHDHIYERGEASGLKYLISGGGGAPLYRVVERKASTRKAEATHHFALFQITKDKVSLSAQRVDGSLIETCGFIKGEPWDCDAPGSKSGESGSAAAPVPPATASRCGCVVPGEGGAEDNRLALAAFGALAALILARRRNAESS